MVVAAFTPGDNLVALRVHHQYNRVLGAETAQQVVDLFGHEHVGLRLDMRAVDYFYFGRHLGRCDRGGNGALHVRDVFRVGFRE